MTNPFSFSFPLLSILLTLASTTSPTATALQILDNSTLYAYAGCWNETTELPGTTRQRALSGGTQTTLPGTMTVPACLGFCAGSHDSPRYAYAGLEYARECWCAGALSALSARLGDGACDAPCDGDPATACGGALRLSVYNLTEEARRSGGRRAREGLGWGGLAVGAGVAWWVL